MTLSRKTQPLQLMTSQLEKEVVLQLELLTKASNYLGRLRYQLSKSRKQNGNGEFFFLLNHVIDQIDKKDDEFSGESSKACLVETTAERYRLLRRPYLRSAGFEESLAYMLAMSPLMNEPGTNVSPIY